MALYGAGWCLLASAVLAPLIGIGIGLSRPGQIGTHVYGIPAPATLLVRTLTMSGIATLGAILLGLMPAALLGSAQGRRLAGLTGLALAPLLIPPQVYAYAWQIALSPQAFLGRIINSGGNSPWVGGAVRAGLISAAWLWPVVTLIVSAGWRSTGQAIYGKSQWRPAIVPLQALPVQLEPRDGSRPKKPGNAKRRRPANDRRTK